MKLITPDNLKNTSIALYAIALILLISPVFYGTVPEPGKAYPATTKISMITILVAVGIRFSAYAVEENRNKRIRDREENYDREENCDNSLPRT